MPDLCPGFGLTQEFKQFIIKTGGSFHKWTCLSVVNQSGYGQSCHFGRVMPPLYFPQWEQLGRALQTFVSQSVCIPVPSEADASSAGATRKHLPCLLGPADYQQPRTLSRSDFQRLLATWCCALKEAQSDYPTD